MANERDRNAAEDQGLANMSVNTSRRPAGSPPEGPPEGHAGPAGGAGTPGGEALDDEQIPEE